MLLMAVAMSEFAQLYGRARCRDTKIVKYVKNKRHQNVKKINKKKTPYMVKFKWKQNFTKEGVFIYYNKQEEIITKL